MSAAKVDPPDPNILEEMRRIAYDNSKWLSTITSSISQYEYSLEELDRFYDNLSDVVGRLKDHLLCPICSKTQKQNVVLDCGHWLCKKCSVRWLGRSSNCPTCKNELLSKPVPLFAADEIISESAKFLKEAKFFKTKLKLQDGGANQTHENGTSNSNGIEPKKLLKNMNFILLQRLKNLESQLMCDYCFLKIDTTTLVNCASDAITRRPFCKTCVPKYIRFYEKEQGRSFDDPVSFPLFDQVVEDMFDYLNKIYNYSKATKKPTRYLNSTGTISLRPVYKLLLAAILIGLLLVYVSA